MIAAKATCFKIAASEAFRDYQAQIRANADALADALSGGGLDLLTGGTDTHLLQVDLRRSDWTGRDAEERLHEVRITANRNTVPFDERPPTVASGLRLGTPAVTMRGFDEDGLARGGRDHRRRARRRPGPRRLRGAEPRRSASAARSTRASAATRRTSHERRHRSGSSRSTHPLVQHKLGLLRDETTPTQMFRQLVNELTLLLTYEATKDLATEEVEIETPLERTTVQRISGKKVAVCPILRAGVGMLDGVLSLISGARVGFIGLYRNEETLEPVEYYVKLPHDIAERDVILLDPMLATGNSTAAAVETREGAPGRSRAADRAHRRARGHRADAAEHPDVTIVVAAIDRELNEQGYILPGLGDAGRPALRNGTRAPVRPTRGARA